MTSPPVTEPTEWLILFHREATHRIVRFMPGRFKHVSLAAFVPDAGAWVHLNWQFARLRVDLISDGEIERWLAERVGGAGVLRMPAPPFDDAALVPRLGLSCCSLACHVLGVRGGALWPDGLWRLLLRHGAEIMDDGRPSEAEAAEAVGERNRGAGDRQPRTA